MVMEVPLPGKDACKQILVDCLNGLAKTFPGIGKLSSAHQFDACAGECVGLDGRAIRKVVANALAADPQVAIDPNKLSVEHLRSAIRQAKQCAFKEGSKMTTVVSRTFRSSPHRDALQTWDAIVELLTQGKDGTARSELRAVTGVAASLIADQAPKSAPIVATCDGPRTRIYCLFDEDAIYGDDANEEVLGFEPLKGDWGVSLPCPKEQLGWVQSALKSTVLASLHGT